MARISGYSTLPIYEGIFNGVPTNEAPRQERLIRIIADGTVTIHFPSGDEVLDVLAGDTFALSARCTGISSTVKVLLV